MRPRAIKELAKLGNPAFFKEIAVGLELIIANARRLYSSATSLAQSKHFHGAHVLEALSKEEAAKYLILLDAIRCPRSPSGQLVKQLDRFANHLAKGLYVEAAWMRPATLGELQRYLDAYRETLYLDGPNDVDWIFRNQIERRREETLYVDLVEYDDGTLSWVDPKLYYESTLDDYTPREDGVLLIAGLLHDSGVSTSDALAVIAEVWRPMAMQSAMKRQEIQHLNHRTLDCLRSKGLLREPTASDYEMIIDRWQFPLYTLDLRPIKVSVESLREKQSLWNPGYY
ncbi:hypothetical protein YTPLAS72_26700 [Nitrospira sp.]|nr:hypothetical protein YTPLAS72_26700 [Nitrospira sp.]